MKENFKSIVKWLICYILIGYGFFSLVQDIIYKIKGIWI